MSASTTSTEISEKILILIDTDSNPHQFKKQLCAYATGQIGDDIQGIGHQASREDLQHKDWWNDNIEMVADDHFEEYLSPCCIAQSPTTPAVYQSVAIQVKALPPDYVLEEAKSKILKFFDEIWKRNDLTRGDRNKVVVTGIRVVQKLTETVITETIREDEVSLT